MLANWSGFSPLKAMPARLTYTPRWSSPATPMKSGLASTKAANCCRSCSTRLRSVTSLKYTVRPSGAG